MSTRKWILLGALILLLCCPCRADDSAARKAIQAQYDRWAAAYVKNDAATLLSLLAPDFRLKTGSGKVLTRAQYKAILLKRAKQPTATAAYAIRIQRLTVMGDAATVYATETQTDNKDATMSAGKPAPKTHVHQYRDKWTLRNKEWLLASSETLAEH